jgi:hypothetical protein
MLSQKKNETLPQNLRVGRPPVSLGQALELSGGDTSHPGSLKLSANIAAHETRWIIGTLLVLVMGAVAGDGAGGLVPHPEEAKRGVSNPANVFRGVLEAISMLMVICFSLLLVGRQAPLVRGFQLPAFQDLGNLLRSRKRLIELLLSMCSASDRS